MNKKSPFGYRVLRMDKRGAEILAWCVARAIAHKAAAGCVKVEELIEL